MASKSATCSSGHSADCQFSIIVSIGPVVHPASKKLTLPAMTRDNPPILICRECRRPMDFLAVLPHVANLPAVYAYKCLPCRRVDTITLPPR